MPVHSSKQVVERWASTACGHVYCILHPILASDRDPVNQRNERYVRRCKGSQSTCKTCKTLSSRGAGATIGALQLGPQHDLTLALERPAASTVAGSAETAYQHVYVHFHAIHNFGNVTDFFSRLAPSSQIRCEYAFNKLRAWYAL